MVTISCMLKQFLSRNILGNGYYLYTKPNADKNDNVCNITIKRVTQADTEKPFSVWDLWLVQLKVFGELFVNIPFVLQG